MDSTFVLYLLGAVVLVVVFLLLGRRSGWTLVEIRHVVASLVDAAEQMMPGQIGAQKLEWVLAQADELGVTKYIHATLLRAMIESAVLYRRRSEEPKAAALPQHPAHEWRDRG